MLLCACGAGELTVVVDDAVYGLEVTRQHERKSGEDHSALLCLVAMEESLCVNISSNITHCGCRSFHTQLSPSFPWLRSAGMFCGINDSCYSYVLECSTFLSLSIGSGLPLSSRAGVNVNWNDSSACARLELHAEASGLTATLEQSSHHKTETTGHSQVRESLSNCGSLKGSHSSQILFTPADTQEQMQYLCSFFSSLFLFYATELVELPGCMQTKELLCINEFTRFELTKVKMFSK